MSICRPIVHRPTGTPGLSQPKVIDRAGRFCPDFTQLLSGGRRRAAFWLAPSKCVLPLWGALTGSGCSAAWRIKSQSEKRREARARGQGKRAWLAEQRARLLALANRRRRIARRGSSGRSHRLGQHCAVMFAVAAATNRKVRVRRCARDRRRQRSRERRQKQYGLQTLHCYRLHQSGVSPATRCVAPRLDLPASRGARGSNMLPAPRATALPARKPRS